MLFFHKNSHQLFVYKGLIRNYCKRVGIFKTRHGPLSFTGIIKQETEIKKIFQIHPTFL